MSIREYNINDKENILKVWEDSVRSSHYFLKEEDIKQIRNDIKEKYLDAVKLWVYEINEELVGFIGTNKSHIEMLFISQGYQNKGIGKKLIDYISSLSENISVDVNEQNTKALNFYLKYGFKQIGRSEKDSEGRPFPIIHLIIE